MKLLLIAGVVIILGLSLCLVRLISDQPDSIIELPNLFSEHDPVESLGVLLRSDQFDFDLRSSMFEISTNTGSVAFQSYGLAGNDFLQIFFDERSRDVDSSKNYPLDCNYLLVRIVRVDNFESLFQCLKEF